MDTITLQVGSEVVIDGHMQENLRPVTFEGEKLGNRRWFTDDRGTRGVDETLYRTADGRLVVYVENWSWWPGEPDSHKLVEVQPAALDVGGQFEMLGRACGMARPLTLDEALQGGAQASSADASKPWPGLFGPRRWGLEVES